MHGFHSSVCRVGLDIKFIVTFIYLYIHSFSLIQLTKAFAHVRVLIYENFGRYDVAEGQKGGDEVCIVEFLRQMVDKEVATFGALDLLVRAGELRLLRCRRSSGRSRRERGEPWNPGMSLIFMLDCREDTISVAYSFKWCKSHVENLVKSRKHQ